MGIKKRTKVSAEFSMSSLTDIIFLLLIFFMLTSSLVAPNSLNLRLPGTSTARPVDNEKELDDVAIRTSGRFYLNGVKKSFNDLERELGLKARRSSGQLNMTLSPASDATNEDVVKVMDLAVRLKINAILNLED